MSTKLDYRGGLAACACDSPSEAAGGKAGQVVQGQEGSTARARTRATDRGKLVRATDRTTALCAIKGASSLFELVREKFGAKEGLLALDDGGGEGGRGGNGTGRTAHGRTAPMDARAKPS